LRAVSRGDQHWNPNADQIVPVRSHVNLAHTAGDPPCVDIREHVETQLTKKSHCGGGLLAANTDHPGVSQGEPRLCGHVVVAQPCAIVRRLASAHDRFLVGLRFTIRRLRQRGLVIRRLNITRRLGRVRRFVFVSSLVGDRLLIDVRRFGLTAITQQVRKYAPACTGDVDGPHLPSMRV
jgi:hypothetical protein